MVGQVREGRRGQDEWVAARDLSCCKLNLSSSLLHQARPLCPWTLSADSAGFVFAPSKKYQACNLITKVYPRTAQGTLFSHSNNVKAE